MQKIFYVLLFFSSFAFAQPDALIRQLHEWEKSFGGRIGFMAKNLDTGETLAYRAEEKFPTASTIKLPVMVEYFYQAAEGKVSATQKILLPDSLKVGGSGLFQYFQGTTEQQLLDAVLLMIVISDNSATNMVVDALGRTLPEKLNAVNGRMQSLGLQNTRLRNRLMAWKTKTDSAESIRYGVGVSTAADMVLLLEKMYRGQLVDSSASKKMTEILSRQFYNDLLPRYLPFENHPDITVAHKTGSVTGVQADVGLVLSEKLHMAIAVFSEQAQDRRDGPENLQTEAIARACRLAWNHFTGENGFDRPFFSFIDWTSLPGGQWTRVYLQNAPYPHQSRINGHSYKDQTFPYDPHYCDSSVVIMVPDNYHDVDQKVDLIVHFHGWNNDVLGVLEQFYMAQQLIASRKNAILVLAQGPYRANDSGGGKMEDDGGFQRLVQEVVDLLHKEKKTASSQIGRVIITAHSGGYRPAIYSVSRGGLQQRISEVYLFDAFYGLTEELIPWLKSDKHHYLRSIYTEHLAQEHQEFMALLKKNKLSWSAMLDKKQRIVLLPTGVCHNCVIQPTFLEWLKASSLSDR